MTYILTWQPEICPSGQYFVTVLNTDGHELRLSQIIEAAHDIEELPPQRYDICSLIRADNAEVVDIEELYV